MGLCLSWWRTPIAGRTPRRRTPLRCQCELPECWLSRGSLVVQSAAALLTAVYHMLPAESARASTAVRLRAESGEDEF